MNKTAIRNFAVWARNKLMTDISYQAGLMGISKDGITSALQQSTDNIEFYDIGASEPYAIRDDQIRQRKSLVDIIKTKEKESGYLTAYNSVIEEVAYTWFNRLIAVRFMEVNDYLPAHVRVLSSDSGKQEPDIVTSPFDAELCFGEGEEQEIVQMKNENRLDEVFRILFIKQCRELSLLLPRLFEGTNDYTELLLNLSFIDQDGVVYHLVHDIPEDDFNVEKGGQVEIIGWLYQYYISDQKEYLINAHKKYKRQDIPYVTQLFTPEWIVKYLVENCLGRLWLNGHPNDPIVNCCDFYLETIDNDLCDKDIHEIKREHSFIRPEDIRLIDPCVGSGHILVCAFDLLMNIYRNAGWTDREASKSIIENNLFGVDIDERAGQLAYFSVMMKARQYNRAILRERVNCNVFSLIESDDVTVESISLFSESEQNTIRLLLEGFKNIKEIGSLINLNVSYIKCMDLLKAIGSIEKNDEFRDIVDYSKKSIVIRKLKPIVECALVLLDEYDVVITNPPYMNLSQMPDTVKKYLAKEYSDFKNDLFAAFVYKAINFCKKNGYVGLLTPYVWMFISSYEQMRIWINENASITSLVQLEYNAFEAACVPVAAFTLCKTRCNFLGEYIKLSDFKGVENQEPKTKEAVKKRDCGYRYSSSQSKYRKIPGEPIAYWASDRLSSLFCNKNIDYYVLFRQGMATSDNGRFLRLWFEVDLRKSKFDAIDLVDAQKSQKKWFAYNKGGSYRKWYGNLDYVVNWEDDGKEMKDFTSQLPQGMNVRLKSREYYFKECFSWSKISSSLSSFRFYPEGCAFDVAGCCVFNAGENLLYFLALTNSAVTKEITDILSPTLNFELEHLKKLPVIFDTRKNIIDKMAQNCIDISKIDWDSFETSWAFQKHPLI